VSSVHITFSSGEEWAALGGLGWGQRRGIQYHWDNEGYSCFEDFLAQMKQSKRKSIRQVGAISWLSGVGRGLKWDDVLLAA
jgi:predicted N-acyltransferase